MKTCETCKHRGNPIGNSDWLYWCEAKKDCVDGSAWEKLDHPTEKVGVEE